MHVDIVKALFIGTAKNKASFFKAIQKLGSVHFITNGNSSSEYIGELVSLYAQAVKILEHYGKAKESEGEVTHPYEFCKTVIELENKKESLSTLLKQLSKHLEEIAAIGAIPFADLDLLSSYSSITPRLFVAPTTKMADSLIPDLIPLVKDGTREYFISFSNDPPSLSGLREIVLDEKLRRLGTEHAQAKAELEQTEQELKRRSLWLPGLKEAFVQAMNATKRESFESQARAPLDTHLFAIQGWIPQTHWDKVQALCLEENILLEKISPNKGEVLPSFLENQGLARVGEDLLQIYDTPAYNDSDPSLWVLGFFSLFFAIIINDSGYGLLFLLSALWIYFKSRPKAALGKRVVTLFGLLGISCIGWGLLTQSFFGMEISKDNPLHALSVVDPLLKLHAQYDIDQGDKVWQTWAATHKEAGMPTLEEFLYSPTDTGKVYAEIFKDHLFFEIALIVGVCHLILGMARYLSRHKAYAGWIIFVIGAYMYLPQQIGAISIIQCIFSSNPQEYAYHGASLMIIGFSAAALLTIIQHGFSAIFEAFMTPIQLFSDVLSYLRLYALSMSGAIVALLINQLDTNAPPVIAWILIPFCHVVNMFICMVGGIIHGLRLNFLEWYHYSFIGGGKRFVPLAFEKYI